MDKLVEKWEKTGLLTGTEEGPRQKQLAMDLDEARNWFLKNASSLIPRLKMGKIFTNPSLAGWTMALIARLFDAGVYMKAPELCDYLEKMSPAFLKATETEENRIAYYGIDSEVIFIKKIADALIKNKKYKTPDDLYEDMKKDA